MRWFFAWIHGMVQGLITVLAAGLAFGDDGVRFGRARPSSVVSGSEL